MMDAKTVNQPINVTPNTEVRVRTAMQEACEAYRDLEETLQRIGYDRRQWAKPHANFRTMGTAMPDVTLGELMAWVENFTCIEGPQLLSQPAGPALDRARARQLHSLMTPIMANLDEVCVLPTARTDTPMLAKSLCHPRVHTDLADLFARLGILGNI